MNNNLCINELKKNVNDNFPNFNIVDYNILNTDDVNHQYFNINFLYKSNIKFFMIINNLCNFYFVKSNNFNLNKINFDIIKYKLDFYKILGFIDDIFSKKKLEDYNIIDKFNIYREKKLSIKYKIDNFKLKKYFEKNIDNNENNLLKFPKDLLFTKDQIYEMILKEINSVNISQDS